MPLSAIRAGAAAMLIALPVTACSTSTTTAPTPVPTGAVTITPLADVATPVVPEEVVFTPSPTVMADKSGVLPIFEGEIGFVLGGVKDGRWLDADETAALATGRIPYRLFSGSRLTAEFTGTITPFNSDPCPYPRVPHLGPELTDTIGVAGDWDVAPRAPDSLNLGMPEYVSMVEGILTETGAASPEVILTEVLRIDLEGDGIDEVLVSASRLYGMREAGHVIPEVQAGDYALVALRKEVEGEVKTLIVDLNAYPETLIPGYFWLPTVLTLLDLNGDGDLEIVVEQLAFEGRIIEVYEVNGAEVKMVLSAGCSI